MSIKETTACFTGHRELREPVADIADRLSKIIERLIQSGCLNFCAGGARGFDALASEAVVALQTRYPEINLILMLPFPEQYSHEHNWSQAEIEQYHRLQSNAAQVITLADAYCPGIYYRRNRSLVDACVLNLPSYADMFPTHPAPCLLSAAGPFPELRPPGAAAASGPCVASPGHAPGLLPNGALLGAVSSHFPS